MSGVLDSDKAEGMLEAIVGGERERDPGEYDYWKNNVFYEVGADLFSLYLCYGKDFEFFLRNLWNYLKPIGVRGKEEIYFARSFCLYECWKYLLSTGRRRFPEKSLHLDRDIVELTRILARLGFHIQAKSRAQDEARQMFAPIRSLLEWYVQDFRLRAPVTDLKKGLSKAKNALAAVSRGRVFTGGIDEPHIFILGLKQKSRKKPLDISVRIAAILSLWDTALRKRNNTP